MKRMIILVFAVALMVPAISSYAKDDKVPKEKKAKKEKVVKEKKAKMPPAPLASLTLEGQIAKVEKAGKERPAKDGKPAKPATVSVSYTLTTPDGTVVKLPAIKKPGKKKGEAAPAATINMADFADANVTLVGKGTQTEKNGKKNISIKEIASVVKK